MPIKPSAFIQPLTVSTLFGFLYVLVLGWGVAYGAYYSLDWPLRGNGVVMQYIAWRILGGAAPYRDLFEQDFPGAYVLHMASIRMLGRGDVAFRLLNLFFCLLAVGSLLLLSWRESRCYAVAGALFYIAFHLSMGARSMAERDFMMVPFLLLAAGALRAFFINPARLGALFILGLLTSCAFWIKPTGALFALLAGGAIWFQAGRWQGKIVALIAIGLGMLLPAAFIHLWLYRLGALPPFYDILFHFTLPIYRHFPGYPGYSGVYFLMLGLCIIPLLTFFMYRCSEAPAADKTVLAIGLAYGFLHIYLQGKGTPYHSYPLAAFIILYVILVLPRIRWSWPMGFVYSAILIACLIFSPLYALSEENLTEYKKDLYSGDIRQAADATNEALRTVPGSLREAYLLRYPHQAVQILSQSSDLWTVAYQQSWIMPIRQIMPFSLYGTFHSRYMDGLAAELFHDLSTIRPLVILVSAKAWPYKTRLVYTTIDTQEPWKAFFAQNYRLTKRMDSYRIYARIK